MRGRPLFTAQFTVSPDAVSIHQLYCRKRAILFTGENRRFLSHFHALPKPKLHGGGTVVAFAAVQDEFLPSAYLQMIGCPLVLLSIKGSLPRAVSNVYGLC